MRYKFCLIILPFLLSACGNDTVESIQNLQNAELNEVLDKAHKDIYDPPADGKLSEDHIKMYMEVKKREQTLLKSEAGKVKEKINKAENADKESVSGFFQNLDAIQQAASYTMLDIRAAQELNYNTAEYEWVKNILLDVSSMAMVGDMKKSQGPMIDNMEQSIAQLEITRDGAKDPQLRAILDQQITDSRQSIEQMKKDFEEDPLTPVEEHNLALYTKYKNELKVMENEMNKWQQLGIATAGNTQDDSSAKNN